MVPLIVAVGNGLTVTTALPDCDCVHAELLASLTLTREYVNVPAVLVETATFTLLLLVVETVRSLPLLILYVKVYGAVPDAPVKVMFGEVEFLQTIVVPLMVAAGNGLIVTVALPDCV